MTKIKKYAIFLCVVLFYKNKKGGNHLMTALSKPGESIRFPRPTEGVLIEVAGKKICKVPRDYYEEILHPSQIKGVVCFYPEDKMQTEEISHESEGITVKATGKEGITLLFFVSNDNKTTPHPFRKTSGPFVTILMD